MSFATLLVIKATLTLGAAFAVAALCRRSRASMRHLVFALAFAVLLLLPLSAAYTPAWTLRVPGGLALERLAVGAIDLVSVSTVLVVVWAVGAVLFLAPVVSGLWHLSRLRHEGLPWSKGQAYVQQLMSSLQINTGIQVLRHEVLAGPVTCGVLRPLILFPVAAREWNQDTLRRALVHEFEHIRRRDWLTHCLSRSIAALYWFHPLVWIAWRRLRLEAERACDDAVVGRDDAVAYASLIVDVAEQESSGTRQPVLAMARRGDLSARVTAILDPRQARGQAGVRWIVGALAAAAVLLAALASVKLGIGN